MHPHYKELSRELAQVLGFMLKDEMCSPCSGIYGFLPSFHLLFALCDPQFTYSIL